MSLSLAVSGQADTATSGAARVIIFGGSGFLGRSLARYLVAGGSRVTIVGRSAGTLVPELSGVELITWDARTVGPWVGVLDGASAIVNLAGRSVDCIKTPDHRDEILRSRVESTRVIGKALREAKAPPLVWVQMSTAHIYGDPPTTVCDERSALGHGLAPDVGRAWEAAFAEAVLPSQRGVVLRTSFVLGRGGGALTKLALLARLGLGGTVGSGTQGMSWIHERDMNRIFEFALTNGSATGVYIASSPQPIDNRLFMRTLRRFAGGLGSLGIGLRAPGPLVRVGAPLVMQTDPELALYGRYVMPRRLLDAGFTFAFPHLDGALRDLFAPTPSARAVR
jgi:uncharacterized protein (TIGR01777 family)